jgi:hypothetical protein
MINRIRPKQQAQGLYMKALLAITFVTPFIIPEPAFAHAFGQTYTLPIPSWIFLYGGSATVALSFLLVTFFVGQKEEQANPKQLDISSNPIVKLLTSKTVVRLGKILSALTLALLILAGFLGTQNTTTNIAPTLFWVAFLLGFTYITAVFGNLWSVISPFSVLASWIENRIGTHRLNRLKYPKWLSYSPSIIFYYLLIYNELLSGGQSAIPEVLAKLVLLYTVVTVACAIAFGPETWFKYGEFLGVFFRLVGKISPVYKNQDKIYLRLPFSGLLNDSADSGWVVLFILFMLASTAFDGFRGTTIWFQWDLSAYDYYSMFGQPGYQVFHAVALAFAPLVFLAAYLLAITGMKLLTKNTGGTWDLAKKYAFSLIPIAVVYNLAHYYTLLLTQGQTLLALVSDPLGQGWNFFGTATIVPNPALIRADYVWYSQVFFIVTGHVVAVLISHMIAVRTEKTTKTATLGQIPLLVLMVAYTITGLWILSQPYNFKG